MLRYAAALILAAVFVPPPGRAAEDQVRTQASTPPSTPQAYYVAEFELVDVAGIRPYSAGVAGSFEPYGGQFIVRGGRIAGLEGPPPGARTVIIAFPSMERALSWYNSPAYTALRPIRQRSGASRTYIIEGIAP